MGGQSQNRVDSEKVGGRWDVVVSIGSKKVGVESK